MDINYNMQEQAANDDNAKQPIIFNAPVPNNAVLIVVDVQNGMLNENTDYIPGAINEFINNYGSWFTEIIMMRLSGGDTSIYPSERNGKAGAARVLSNSYQSRLVPPLNKIKCTQVKHKSSTDCNELINILNGRPAYLCGMSTDTIIYPMLACLQNAGVDVNVVYDLTATTVGTAIQVAMKPALIHLLGADKVVEATVPDTTKPLDAVSVIMQAS